jgi:Domain of unknown function (DUF3846)
MKKETKAMFISTDGVCRPVLIDNNDHIHHWIKAQWFDIVRLDEMTDMFVDDTGLIDNRPVNMTATAIATTRFKKPYAIYGDVLVFGHDGQGETIDCPPWVFEYIEGMLNDEGDKEDDAA